MPVSLSRVSVESTAAKVIAGAIEVKNMKKVEERTLWCHPSFQSDT